MKQKQNKFSQKNIAKISEDLKTNTLIVRAKGKKQKYNLYQFLDN